MVCRENKARSAIMGWEKRMLAAAGFDYRDFEAQSAIHEFGHAFAGAADPTPEDYQAWLEGVRQQIINDPTLSDADKYRVSANQPGLVTRIDQEIARVRTGRDEHGRPLTRDQINGGKHFAAMKRLGVVLARQQQAKKAYLETYARTTGCTVGEATHRWNTLVDRPKESREGTQISLRDDWQQRLSVAGVTAQQQADMGQSNETRFALRLMEAERQAAVRALPTRPAIRPEDRVTFTKGPQLRCGQCGQFGHDVAGCPNGHLVDAVEAAARRHDAALAALETQRAAALAAEAVATGAPPQSWVDDHGYTRYELPDGSDTLNLDEYQARLTALSGQFSRDGYMGAQREYAASGKALGDAQEMLKGGPPERPVSTWIESIGFNRDTGLVEVTTAPKRRKTTGEMAPAKTYRYRMSGDEYDAMMASSDVSSYVATHLMARAARGGNARYKWENDADAAEAGVQRRCPSCQQWASLTSAHTCPVAGGWAAAEEANYRERLRQAREKANLDRLPVSLADSTRRREITALTIGDITGGNLRFPERHAMMTARESGVVGMGGFTGQYLDARVTGKVYTWTDPASGQALVTARNVKCSCGAHPCRHTSRVLDTMAVHYGAQRVTQVRPGGYAFAGSDAVSADAPHAGFTRQTYASIRNSRRAAASYHNRVAAQGGRWAQAVSFPLDGQTRQPVRMPETWEGPSGTRVSVDGDSAARDTAKLIQQELVSRTGQRWKVHPRSDGSIVIGHPEQRHAPDGTLSVTSRKSLGAALGLRGMSGPRGVHIPADPSWRHEFLSRAHGATPAVLGSRFAAAGPASAGPVA